MNKLDKRIFELMDELINKNVIRFKVEFCKAAGMYPQNLSQVVEGRNHFTLEQVNSLCKEFNVNANWILGSEDNIFNKNKFAQTLHKTTKNDAV